MLKEMPGVGVTLRNKTECVEFLTLCQAAGWLWSAGNPPLTFGIDVAYPTMRTATNPIGGICFPVTEKITLQQFKERQGIMKYSEGDVLENKFNARKILGW